MKNIQTIITLLTLTALAQTTHAVITVTFTELENDIRVTFDGTIAVDPTITSPHRPRVNRVYVSDSQINVTQIPTGLSTYFRYLGNSTDALTGVTTINRYVNNSTDSGFFGFSSVDSLIFDESAITKGNANYIEEITVSAEDYYFLIEGHTLETMNVANIPDGTVLWRATTTGDTINFVSVPSVPEPASFAAILGCMGLGLTLMRRKHRA